VQPVAAWLVARPQNGVLGLALTLLLPLSPVFSGLVMAHLVFANGVRLPALQGLVAASGLAVLAVVLKASVAQIVASAATWWLPVLVLSALAGHWRSLTLALQVSVIIALVATAGFFVVLGDPADYWNDMVTTSIELARQAGLHEQADMLGQTQAMIVPQMTMLFVFTAWSFYVLVTLFGYALYHLDGSCLIGCRGDRCRLAAESRVRGVFGVLVAGARDTALVARRAAPAAVCVDYGVRVIADIERVAGNVARRTGLHGRVVRLPYPREIEKQGLNHECHIVGQSGESRQYR